MERKEYKIGEVFEFKGKMVKCIESYGCDECCVGGDCGLFICTNCIRKDEKSVKFVEVKVTQKPLTIDWEQRRYELAKAAMQGILADHTVDLKEDVLCKSCIKVSDEMIKQLKQSTTN